MMFFLKVATFFLVALAVGAEKKVELQDIEEDNLRSELKSEIEKDHDKSDGQESSGPVTAQGYNSLDFMKTGFLKFFSDPQFQSLHNQPQQQRYIHQYAVTEPPERYVPAAHQIQYESQAPQQAMVGYLSNMPMQIYLVPQFQQLQQQQQLSPVQTPHALAEFNQNAPHGSSTSNAYVEAYAPRTAPQPVTYVYRAQPTAAPTLAAVQPVLGYHLPILHFNNAVVPKVVAQNVPLAPKPYYAPEDYSDTNAIDETTPQTEIPQYEPAEQEFPRHYNSRAPLRGLYKSHHGIPDLPAPNPLLLKGPPAHLSHIPRALPMLRPYTKQVYQEGAPPPSAYPRPHAAHGPYKRRPTSLLDSYVPSNVQVEYLKRGLVKDPSSLYEALASGRLPHTIPRHLERGFLPNQMYPTGAGGFTYGHYKRNPKIEKFPHK